MRCTYFDEWVTERRRSGAGVWLYRLNQDTIEADDFD